MFAIYKRELKSYFDTMTGWIFIAFMMAVIGIYMFVYNFYYGMPYFGYTLYGCEFLFMIFAPIISMRSMAEERKAKTDQLLLISPVSITKIVVGKYLAMISVLVIALIPFLPVPVILMAAGEGSFLIDYSTMLAFFLLGCLYISIGMLISSLTESQIISAVGSFVVILLIRLWPALIGFLPSSTITMILAKFDLVTIIANFGYNYIFDVSGLILYSSISILLVFITIQLMQRRRWS